MHSSGMAIKNTVGTVLQIYPTCTSNEQVKKIYQTYFLVLVYVFGISMCIFK